VILAATTHHYLTQIERINLLHLEKILRIRTIPHLMSVAPFTKRGDETQLCFIEACFHMQLYGFSPAKSTLVSPAPQSSHSDRGSVQRH